jgi:transcriptional regulator with XRE-family HTH domain
MQTPTDKQTKQLLSANLRKFRGDLTLREVARRVETDASSIKAIEDGVRMPGVGLLARIATALNVSVEDFLKNRQSAHK